MGYSLFTRALAGAGEAASQIGSKYIDEQLAERRAQVLADIAQKQIERADAYSNSDERRGRMRDLASQDVVAAGGAADTVALNTAGNVPLRDAAIARENAINTGTMGTKAAAAGAVAKAQADALPIRLNPGDAAYRSDGSEVARNNGLTGPEATLMAYREGLKGSTRQQKDEAYAALAKSTGEQLRDVQKSLNEGMSQGMLKKPPKDYDGTSKPDPAVEAYLDLDKQRRVLQRAQASITEQWHADIKGGGSAPARPADRFGAFSDGGDTPEVFKQQAREYLDQLGANPNPERRAELERELATLVAKAPPGAIDLDKLKRDAVAPTAAPAPKGVSETVGGAVKSFFERAIGTPESVAAEEAKVQAGKQGAQNEFDADVAKLDPLELLRKYDSYTSRKPLSMMQLAQLKRIEKTVH